MVMKRALLVLSAAAAVAALPAPARAVDGSLSLSVGESVVFHKGDTLRGPFSLELVPSVGWDWFKFDLGLYLTLEDIESSDRNFVIRPGFRITPPMLPLYFRFAVPLQTTNQFDAGFLIGIGAEWPAGYPVALFGEVDTFGTWRGRVRGDNDERGGGNWDTWPLEFKLGIKLNFE
jgi:hypothetical protein